MARHANVVFASGQLLQLTATALAADTKFTFQNRTGDILRVTATVDATPPDPVTGLWYSYRSGDGPVGETLAALFPGIAATRLWAYAATAGTVEVSHA
ncbi:MAG: hypothetical protein V4712_17775 [Pseudomonadota bacterium]